MEETKASFVEGPPSLKKGGRKGGSRRGKSVFQQKGGTAMDAAKGKEGKEKESVLLRPNKGGRKLAG